MTPSRSDPVKRTPGDGAGAQEPDELSDASRTVEVERAYDVDDATPLPDWSGVPGVVGVGAGERRDLDALYYDTAALDLGRAGVALRRRTGGPDEGWHIKGPKVDSARVEWAWPLTAPGEVPDAVRDAAAAWAPGELAPIARIENTRTAYALTDAAGVLVAEFVDDRVRATDLRGVTSATVATDAVEGVRRIWREWEFELGPAAPADARDRAALFAAVERAVRAAGGRAAASESKLARALGQ